MTVFLLIHAYLNLFHPCRLSQENKSPSKIEQYCPFYNGLSTYTCMCVCVAGHFQFKRTFRLNSHLIVIRKTIDSNWFKILLGVFVCIFRPNDEHKKKETKSNGINENIVCNIAEQHNRKVDNCWRNITFVCWRAIDTKFCTTHFRHAKSNAIQWTKKKKT